jgi:hypothetical protein
MINNQYYKAGDKAWLRNFADKHGITFKDLSTKICPHVPENTLRGLWQKKYVAGGSYADALYWYAKAKRKKWDVVGCDGVVNK